MQEACHTDRQSNIYEWYAPKMAKSGKKAQEIARPMNCASKITAKAFYRPAPPGISETFCKSLTHLNIFGLSTMGEPLFAILRQSDLRILAAALADAVTLQRNSGALEHPWRSLAVAVTAH